MRSPPKFIVLAAFVVVAPLDANFASFDRLHRADAVNLRPYTRAVSMAPDRRAGPEAFARQAGIDLKQFQSRHGASGLIRCGGATGSGQITLASDVVTTAAHVFFGQGGKLRSDSCFFEPAFRRGNAIAIDMRTIATGSDRPMDQRATLDWAVARLAKPAEDVTPYRLGPALEVPSPILMYGGGNGRASAMAVERCSTRRLTAVSPEGIREVSFDCSAAHGGSGAALLDGGNGIVGIFVGYRSVDASRARPFSDLHYNFAISVEGPFRRALLAAAAGNDPVRNARTVGVDQK